MKYLFILFAVVLLGMCGGLSAKEVTLVSNEENTRFRLRPYGEQVWREAGTGKILRLELPAKGAYEFTAQAPGYIEKSLTLPELVSEIQFMFMIGDKAPAKSSGSSAASKSGKSGKSGKGSSGEGKESDATAAGKESGEKAEKVSKKSAGVVD